MIVTLPRYSAVTSVSGLAIACIAFAGVASASTSGTSSGGATPSAYIDTPQSSTTVTTFSPGFSSPVYSDSGGFHGAYSSWGWGTSYSYSIPPRRYFFPPSPPALGDPYLRSRVKMASKSLSTIPISLSDYLNEPFYAPLSPFLYEESLSKRRRKAIDDYMAEKQTLISELRDKLDALRASDPSARESQLADFARSQSTRVAAVENKGYEIREDLTHWSLFSDTSDWNEGRTWRLGDDTRWESTMDEAKVMRGAAYFQEGLSPAQRRILREYAMELDDSARGPAADIAIDVHGPYLYFSPETSRIRLPLRVPADLRAKISSYVNLKASLKKEIRDVLYREDRRWFDSKRSAALRTLAQQQEARFAQVDALAEEIRQGLAPLPNPARPQVVSEVLPGALGGRVSAYLDRKADYQKMMTNRLTDLRRQFPSSRVEFVKMGEGYAIQLVAYRRLDSESTARAQRAIDQLGSFNQEQVAAFSALVREKSEIRAELVKASGTLAPAVTTHIVDLILREYASTLSAQELWRQYRDYDDAVLQPGLSPEQRRMLFDAALVKLDLQPLHYLY